MAVCEGKAVLSATSVFEIGRLDVKRIEVKTSKSDASKPPTPLLIFSPILEGTYPVLLFLHGFCILNSFYSQLLQHISSHGFIVVALGDKCNLLTPFKCCCGNNFESAVEVTEWFLSSGFPAQLPDNVTPDLKKLALAGHSKGGNTAFGVAIAEKSLNFLALIGIDPVAGPSTSCLLPPKNLTYIPRSFDLDIPVAVIGTGLGNESKGIIPPFAPDGVNHAEFFNESKPPIYYFLAKHYGHTDMLDDFIAWVASCVARSGEGSKDAMRRGVGGIVVAFLEAYLQGDNRDLTAIVDQPSLAPIDLDPVIFVEEGC